MGPGFCRGIAQVRKRYEGGSEIPSPPHYGCSQALGGVMSSAGSANFLEPWEKCPRVVLWLIAIKR